MELFKNTLIIILGLVLEQILAALVLVRLAKDTDNRALLFIIKKFCI